MRAALQQPVEGRPTSVIYWYPALPDLDLKHKTRTLKISSCQPRTRQRAWLSESNGRTHFDTELTPHMSRRRRRYPWLYNKSPTFLWKSWFDELPSSKKHNQLQPGCQDAVVERCRWTGIAQLIQVWDPRLATLIPHVRFSFCHRFIYHHIHTSLRVLSHLASILIKFVAIPLEDGRTLSSHIGIARVRNK